MKCGCCNGEMRKKSVVFGQGTSSGDFNGKLGMAGVSYGSAGGAVHGMGGMMAGKTNSQSFFANQCKCPEITAPYSITEEILISKASWVTTRTGFVVIFSCLFLLLSVIGYMFGGKSDTGESFFACCVLGIIFGLPIWAMAAHFNLIKGSLYKETTSQNPIYLEQYEKACRWSYEWICLSCGQSIIHNYEPRPPLLFEKKEEYFYRKK